MFAIVTDASEWRARLSDIGRHDFYHTYDFHAISADNGDGQPLMLVHYNDSGRVDFIWPFLERDAGKAGKKDLTSVYGYPGPLFAQGSQGDVSELSIKKFLSDLGYVSVFSRTNPFLLSPQKALAIGCSYSGDVVAMNMQVSPDQQLKSYSERHRRDIKRLIRKGCSVEVTGDLSALDDFQKIYRETMVRLGANRSYFFSDEYIRSLVSSRDFDAFFSFTVFEGQRVAAGIFVKCGVLMQYHLGGTLAEYYKIAPFKLMIYHLQQHHASKELTWFNLGGGVGGSEDALFAFKRGFSSDVHGFFLYKSILDPEEYELMTQRKALSVGKSPEELKNSGFFPAYRCSNEK